MKKIVIRVLLAAMVAAPVTAALTACPEEKKEEPPPPPPPPPPKPVIPEYAPTGDDAELKKQGAAGIDDTNAKDKAAELEKTLNESITKLEAAKAAPADAKK
ncbi:MAG: hypothetical protein A2138_09540 [Deltaproteobacteria bacterium RBG_16_71_12]|nr:MAG: hypothetical protein A2138_09540 [Deltaproteobacteria bacterium RBG_16_71_12]